MAGVVYLSKSILTADLPSREKDAVKIRINRV
jgi:hypothetical protein